MSWRRFRVLLDGLPHDSILVWRQVHHKPEPKTDEEIEAYVTNAGW